LDVDLDTIVRLAVILVAAYVVYELLLRRRADFVIRIRDDRIDFKGNFPLSQRAAIIQFIVNDLSIKGPCKVMGAWKKGRPAIWFAGRLSDGEKQRIRNFLTIGL
jgi:hypothetical protein